MSSFSESPARLLSQDPHPAERPDPVLAGGQVPCQFQPRPQGAPSRYPPSASAMALYSISQSVRNVRSSLGNGLDMTLSDVRACVHALMPLVSLPLWLPFSFMLSIFSYVCALFLNALDASDPHGGEGPSTLQQLQGSFKLQAVGRAASTGSLGALSSISGTLRAPTNGSSGSSILRALDQILDLVTALPSSSPKYGFTRALAEQLLLDNTAQKPPLLELNRLALSRAFRHTMMELETCLLRSNGGGSAWNSLLRRCSQKATTGLAAALGSPATSFSNAAPTPASLRAEKLSQELSWLADRLFDYGGGSETIRLWANAPNLANAARGAGPRVQAHLVKLSASLVRAMAGTGWTVSAVYSTDSLRDGAPLQGLGFSGPSEPFLMGGIRAGLPPPMPLASLDLRYQLLLLWLPLMCRAIHAGDGPVLSTTEKQRTEEALQCTILELPHSQQEVLFASWLHEYSWSSSDWPNLQAQYVAWCERARRVAAVSNGIDGLE